MTGNFHCEVFGETERWFLAGNGKEHTASTASLVRMVKYLPNLVCSIGGGVQSNDDGAGGWSEWLGKLGEMCGSLVHLNHQHGGHHGFMGESWTQEYSVPHGNHFLHYFFGSRAATLNV